tara:strand:- start:4445 stop:5284 length:840 start_codon:yes stop_codon:yes gene_type:complete
MPKISSYTVTTPASGDLLIGSDVNATPNNSTKNFTVGSILDLATTLPALNPALDSNIVGSLYGTAITGNFTALKVLDLTSQLTADTPALIDTIVGAKDSTTVAKNFTVSDIISLVPSASHARILSATSVATAQDPSTTNTELQIEFGAAQTLTDVSLSATGTLTFNTAGYYTIEFNATTDSGIGAINRQSVIMLAMKRNGTLFGTPIGYVTALNVTKPFTETRSNTFNYTALATDTLEFFIIRDGLGEDVGGLAEIRVDVSNPWTNDVPTASLIVSKLS